MQENVRMNCFAYGAESRTHLAKVCSYREPQNVKYVQIIVYFFQEPRLCVELDRFVGFDWRQPFNTPVII